MTALRYAVHVIMLKSQLSHTFGFMSCSFSTHSLLKQSLSFPHAVPSAQGKLPFFVVQSGCPSTLHQSWEQTSESAVLGQCRNSSPNTCWHCRSKSYDRPGKPVGKGIVLAGASSRQSPVSSNKIPL